MRVLLWLVLMVGCGLTRKLLVASVGSAATDRIFDRAELRVYIGQAAPQYLAILSGWLIFELQLILLTNIQGVSGASRAAGADWVNIEGALASVQGGWITVARMRTLKLLGRQDAGAPKALAMLVALAFGLVALLNVPLLIPASADGLR